VSNARSEAGGARPSVAVWGVRVCVRQCERVCESESVRVCVCVCVSECVPLQHVERAPERGCLGFGVWGLGLEMCSGSEAGSHLRLIDFVYHSTLGLRVITKKSLGFGVWGSCTCRPEVVCHALGHEVVDDFRALLVQHLACTEGLGCRV